jgi:hypothetical protein
MVGHPHVSNPMAHRDMDVGGQQDMNILIYKDSIGEFYWAENDESYNLTELVKRAKPMKPIVDGEVIREADTFCPNCKMNVSLIPTRKPSFCFCCGQSLDWSKNENIRQ